MSEFERPGSAVAANRAEDILLLNRWLKAVATLLGADAAGIWFTDEARLRIIARHGIPHAFLVSEPQLPHLPYRPDEEVLVPDATARPDLHAVLGPAALDRTGFFYRRPLIVEPARTIAMIVFARAPRPPLSAREKLLLDELAAGIREEVERHYPPSGSPLSSSMHMTRAELERWLHSTPTPAALFDAGLGLVAGNTPLAALIPGYAPRLHGRHLTELDLPARESLAFLFEHALRTGISTPKIEVEVADPSGTAPARLAVIASPLRPTDGAPRLVVTLEPLAAAAPPRPATARSAGADAGDRATIDFLTETLVRRRSLRSRKGVSYITLRSWRQPIREHQLRALKALKRHSAAALAEEIAGEYADDVDSLLGSTAFRAVVPVPCGHSPGDRCLSVAIARALAKRLDRPMLHALVLPPTPGTSHPRTNSTRPPMSLLHQVEGPVLLVDDVATSGQHIEEACRLIREPGVPVLAMVWIGGDADPAEAPA